MFSFSSNNFIYMFINIRPNANLFDVSPLIVLYELLRYFILYKCSVQLEFFQTSSILYMYHSNVFF